MLCVIGEESRGCIGLDSYRSIHAIPGRVIDYTRGQDGIET